MTLSEALDASLAPGTSQAEAGEVHAEVDVAEVDGLGVRVHRIRVAGPPGDLVDRALRAPDALERPLGERLDPVEVDRGLGGAVLRGPVDRGRFTQVEVDPEGFTVMRPQLTPEGRQPAPWVMTREQLQRTVEGLESLVRPVGDEAL